MKAETIHELYPNVVQVVEDENGFTAYDVNGDVVSVDMNSQSFSEKLTELTGNQKLSVLRAERNIRLAETDHLALSDNTLSTEMASYRQALRDITNTYSDLDTVVWPTKP